MIDKIYVTVIFGKKKSQIIFSFSPAVLGAEKADLSSQGSARSKTDAKGSQVSLKSPTESGGAKEKEPLGSQASLKSTKSSEKRKIKAV